MFELFIILDFILLLRSPKSFIGAFTIFFTKIRAFSSDCYCCSHQAYWTFILKTSTFKKISTLNHKDFIRVTRILVLN